MRFRSFLAALEVSASRFVGGWKKDAEAQSSLDGMIDRTSASAPPPFTGYPFAGKPQRDLARKMVESLDDLHDLRRQAKASVDFVGAKHTSPRPKAALRLRPPLDDDPGSEF